MYDVNVVVEGVGRGLLMHKFSVKATAKMESKVKSSGNDYGTPQDQAEDVSYRLDAEDGQKGQLYLPAEHFLGAITAAGSGLRVVGQGKKTYKGTFSGNLDVLPDCLVLTTNAGEPLFDYKIDSRPVKISATKGRLIRHRPHIPAGWRTNFTIRVEDDNIPLEVVQAALAEAGKSKCVGDFRPRFGQFRIVSLDKAT